MEHDHKVRQYLKSLLSWEDSHLNFENAIQDIPAEWRGKKPPEFPYSIWQLVEHIRIAQWDILDFSRNPAYKEIKWPDEYWPEESAPANDDQWNKSIQKIIDDRREFITLIEDRNFDLFKPFEHGTGQTLFRQAVLIADHTAYHVGQIVLLRKIIQAHEK